MTIVLVWILFGFLSVFILFVVGVDCAVFACTAAGTRASVVVVLPK